MSDHFPRDVLIDVLIRLPINTLLQCTCVCKSWYSLLTNPSFITTHLNHYSDSDSDNDLLIIRTYNENRKEEEYSLYCDNENFNEYAKLEFPLKSKNEYFNVIGCCNGLICFSDDLSSYVETLFLWNPSIRKSVALPPVRVGFQSHGPFSHTIGFGFDPLTNDYKVVRIVYLGCELFPPEVDVFTVNSGTWRNIGHLGLPYFTIEKTRQAYLNDAAHWLAFDNRDEIYHLIVSFNMIDEVFREIKLPGIIANRAWVKDDVDIVNFQGSISLFETTISNRRNYCIWVMKEYGVAESWTKQIIIDLPGHDFKWFAGFRNNGKVLLASTRRGRRGFYVEAKSAKVTYLECYDPKTKVTKQCNDLPIRSFIESFYGSSFYCDAYKESLVLLGVTFCDTLACEGSPDLHEEGSGLEKTKEEKGKGKNRKSKGGSKGKAKRGVERVEAA